jgi:single-strand DNA-binding protein
MNVVVLAGVLSRAPEERELPSGDHLVAYEVTTSEQGRKADSVPVVWPDPPAGAIAFEPGAEVVVVGRVRRRFFRAGGATQSRTEVIAESVLRPSQRRRVSAAIARARDQLE